jgi:DnaJ-class molecular chaperone
MNVNEVLKRKKINIHYNRVQQCECIKRRSYNCNTCGGKAYLSDLSKCPSCLKRLTCQICKDKFVIKLSHELTYIPDKYPKGGQVHLFQHRGNYDIRSDSYGDLLLKVNIVSDYDNVTITNTYVESIEQVELKTLIEGGKIEINTIRGKKYIYLEPGIQPDDYKILDNLVNIS